MLKRLLLALGLLFAPADAFAQSSKLSNLTAGAAIAGTDLFYDVQSVGVGGVKVTGTQLSTFVLTPPVNVALGTITTNTLGVNITGTFNAVGTTFDAPLFMNIVNTASAAGSLLADLQVGSSTIFSVNVAGLVVAAPQSSAANPPTAGFQVGTGGTRGNIWSDSAVTNAMAFSGQGDARASFSIGNSSINIGSIYNLGWVSTSSAVGTASPDTSLSRQAAGIVALNNGTNPTTFRAYNTADSSTAPTNYERGVIDFTTTANVLTIGTQKGGTGTLREAALLSASGTYFSQNGIVQWTIFNGFLHGGTGTLSFGTASAIGAVGTTQSTLWQPAAKVIAVGDGTQNTNGWINWAGETRVAADVTNTTTTLATATGLSAALQAGRTYSFEVELPFTDAAAGGIQAALVATGGLTATNIIYDGWIVDSAANGIKGNAQSAALGGVVASAVTAGTAGHVTISGTITVNVAGTLNVQFAQNTSNATATTIKRGAYMWLHDMP